MALVRVVAISVATHDGTSAPHCLCVAPTYSDFPSGTSDGVDVWRAGRVLRNSAKTSIILRLNAGMSSGFRDVTRPRSSMTSPSTQIAPAFLKSVLSDGHDVTRRSRSASASMSIHGP